MRPLRNALSRAAACAPLEFEPWVWETDECYNLSLPYAVSPDGRFAVVSRADAGFCFAGDVQLVVLDREQEQSTPTPIELEVPDLVAVDNSGRVLAGPLGGPFEVWESGPAATSIADPCMSPLGEEFFAFAVAPGGEPGVMDYCVRGSTETVSASHSSTGNRYLINIGASSSMWFDASDQSSGTFSPAMHTWMSAPGVEPTCATGATVLDDRTVGRSDWCPTDQASDPVSATFESRSFIGTIVENHVEPDLGFWGEIGVAQWSATGRGYIFGESELVLVDLDRGRRDVVDVQAFGIDIACFSYRNAASVFWGNRIPCGG